MKTQKIENLSEKKMTTRAKKSPSVSNIKKTVQKTATQSGSTQLIANSLTNEPTKPSTMKKPEVISVSPQFNLITQGGGHFLKAEKKQDAWVILRKGFLEFYHFSGEFKKKFYLHNAVKNFFVLKNSAMDNESFLLQNEDNSWSFIQEQNGRVSEKVLSLLGTSHQQAWLVYEDNIPILVQQEEQRLELWDLSQPEFPEKLSEHIIPFSEITDLKISQSSLFILEKNKVHQYELLSGQPIKTIDFDFNLFSFEILQSENLTYLFITGLPSRTHFIELSIIPIDLTGTLGETTHFSLGFSGLDAQLQTVSKNKAIFIRVKEKNTQNSIYQISLEDLLKGMIKPLKVMSIPEAETFLITENSGEYAGLSLQKDQVNFFQETASSLEQSAFNKIKTVYTVINAQWLNTHHRQNLFLVGDFGFNSIGKISLIENSSLNPQYNLFIPDIFPTKSLWLEESTFLIFLNEPLNLRSSLQPISQATQLATLTLSEKGIPQLQIIHSEQSRSEENQPSIFNLKKVIEDIEIKNIHDLSLSKSGHEIFIAAGETGVYSINLQRKTILSHMALNEPGWIADRLLLQEQNRLLFVSFFKKETSTALIKIFRINEEQKLKEVTTLSNLQALTDSTGTKSPALEISKDLSYLFVASKANQISAYDLTNIRQIRKTTEFNINANIYDIKTLSKGDTKEYLLLALGSRGIAKLSFGY